MGQIYIPVINKFLLVCSLAFVTTYGSINGVGGIRYFKSDWTLILNHTRSTFIVFYAWIFLIFLSCWIYPAGIALLGVMMMTTIMVTVIMLLIWKINIKVMSCFITFFQGLELLLFSFGQCERWKLGLVGLCSSTFFDYVRMELWQQVEVWNWSKTLSFRWIWWWSWLQCWFH